MEDIMNIFKKMGVLCCLTIVFVFSVNSGQEVDHGEVFPLKKSEQDAVIRYLKANLRESQEIERQERKKARNRCFGLITLLFGQDHQQHPTEKEKRD